MVGLSTEQGLANLWLGFPRSRGDGKGDPDAEYRNANADADDERGLRLIGPLMGDWTEPEGDATEPETEDEPGRTSTV